jgi:hypothetical protein
MSLEGIEDDNGALLLHLGTYALSKSRRSSVSLLRPSSVTVQRHLCRSSRTYYPAFTLAVRATGV